MLLILPIFLTIVFTIMEIGYVSFRLIVLNHATYEVARIGGMTYLLQSGGDAKMNVVMKRFFSGDPSARVSCQQDMTLEDKQAMQWNMDLVCTGRENVKLIFMPLTFFLASKGAPRGTRTLVATVRMPIEQPLKQ
jgi:hypothetical protein